LNNGAEVMFWYQQYVTFHFTGGPAPSIPGSYCSPEQTESFPLKRGRAGNRANGLRSIARCFSGSADKNSSGLRIIVLCFVALTMAVVIALAIQIYYGDYQVSKHILFVNYSAPGN
jgi:hypothetical protein